MTDQELRTALERAAERAPEIVVPRDLFDRGRRSAARARMLAVGAVVACLAMLVGGTLQLTRPDEVPVADDDGLAVPDRIELAPAHLAADEGWRPEYLADDLAVGRAAAAYLTNEGMPVVVDADDGDYHLLDLPGLTTPLALLTASSSVLEALALSPDGRRLAWGYAGPPPASDASPMPSGVRIADLETGEVIDAPIEGGRGVLVERLAWSPNGAWLAWHGQQVRYWTDSSLGGGRPVAGTVAPGGAVRSRHLDEDLSYAAIAVSDTGRLAIVNPQALMLDQDLQRLRLGDRAAADAWFVGERLHLLSVELSGGETSAPPEVQRLPGGDPLSILSLESDGVVLGAPDARTVLVGDLAGAGETDGPPPRVSAYSWSGGGRDSADRDLIRVDRGVASLTLATGLMTRDDATATRPEPDWPWSPLRKIAVLGSIATAGLLAAVITLAVVRRRRTT